MLLRRVPKSFTSEELLALEDAGTARDFVNFLSYFFVIFFDFFIFGIIFIDNLINIDSSNNRGPLLLTFEGNGADLTGIRVCAKRGNGTTFLCVLPIITKMFKEPIP